MSVNKALFLDRDGVINVDHGYVSQKEQFEFINGIFELCNHAKAMNYMIIIVTNQSGIGRGYYSQADFDVLTAWMSAEFAKQGISITQVYNCPHHPEKAEGDYKIDCQCRKPQPGMILQAAAEHHIDVTQSVLIGDKMSDMKAAEAAGIPKRVLLNSLYNEGIDDFGLASLRVASLSDIYIQDIFI